MDTWSDKDGEHAIGMLHVSRICELLDYATNYGMLNEEMPDGQQGKNDVYSVMTRERRTAIEVYKTVLGIIPVKLDHESPPKTWKIVGVDNYAREYVSDFLVAEGLTNEELGGEMVDDLNSMDDTSYFYRLFPSEYRLSRGMEDLV